MKRLFLGLILVALCGVSGCASITPAPVAGRPGVVIQATWKMKGIVPHFRRVKALPMEELPSAPGVDEAGNLVMVENPKANGDHFWRKNNGWAWGTGLGGLSLLGVAIDKNSGGGGGGRLSQVDQDRPGACNFAGADNRGATVHCDAHDSHDTSSGP